MENKKIALFCDDSTIETLLKIVPEERVVCIVAAEIRPNSIGFMKNVIRDKKHISFLIQPKYNTQKYNNFIEDLAKLNLNLLLCYSYSMLVRTEMIEIFNNNCINLHGSLLPKNRGPNPVQWALIKGEKKTGTTLHYMDCNIDTGPIIAQKEVDIDFEDTWVSLFKKVKKASVELLEEQINCILDNEIQAIKQNEFLASTNFRLNFEFPRIDFSKMTDLQIYNLIRAQVHPLKGAYIEHKNKRIYFGEIIPINKIEELRKEYIE